MGYDMNLRLRVEPVEKFREVADAIKERFGQPFNEEGTNGEYGEDWNYDTRWSNLTKDMVALSRDFPEVRIEIFCESDDGSEWVERFLGGKYHSHGRSDWTPDAWDDALLVEYSSKPADRPKAYTVILLYPDMEGRHPRAWTWMGTAHGATVAEAIADARRQIIENNGDTFSQHQPESFAVVAVIEGQHDDIQNQ